ncbi:MAG: universal stress protein [Ottowia sp.]|nr:universal stress protein [Ottowia sp.]
MLNPASRPRPPRARNGRPRTRPRGPRFMAAGQALLDEAANGLRQDGLAVETVLLESGAERVSEQIAKQAEASACDLVILGTHGRRGVDRLLLGSDAEQIARIAPVPVMLVRQPHRKGIT